MSLQRPRTAPKLYAQDGKGYEAVVFEHYFVAGCDWLVTEYDPKDDLAFGWACLGGDRQMAELGYTNLAELEAVQVPVCMRVNGQEVLGHVPVERDEHWPAGMTLRQAIEQLDRASGR